ncbi:MAG: hypothetical protein KOO61_02350 [Spirochaetales bacterium]|nr:hypothetical protein [Spirochaetales bacterium]
MILGALLFGLAGCSQTPEEVQVNLPVTPVISVRPRWAVAVDAYVRVRAEPLTDSVIRGHLRTGDVAEIVSISTTVADVNGSRDTWYEVDVAGLRGWALGSTLEFYESQSRALNVAERQGSPPEGPEQEAR